jgi:hypothetical protein
LLGYDRKSTFVLGVIRASMSAAVTWKSFSTEVGT